MHEADSTHSRSDLFALLTDLQWMWSDPAFGRRLPGIRQHGLSSVEIRVLWILGSIGPLRISALAELLGTGVPTVSKAVARIGERSWIERRRDATDGRAHDLVLTSAGRAATKDLYRAGEDMMGVLLADWTDEAVRSATGHFERLLESSKSFAASLDEE